MFWQKKEKGLPELPPLPEIPRKPIKSDKSTELPRFSDFGKERGFGQSMIKEAVAPSNPNMPIIPSIPMSRIKEQEDETLSIMPSNRYKVVEMDDWKPSKLEFSRPLPMPPENPNSIKENQPTLPPIRSEKSVFVKLDKFYEAKATLETVQEKLKEIDQVMLKIKEVKIKEEEEIEHSEKEIEMIKARINSILKGLFDAR